MKKNYNWRINVVLAIIFLFGAAIISRLFFLQVLEHKKFQAQALGQQVGFNSITGSRGQILCQRDEETKSLAINKDQWTISASLKDIPDKGVFSEVLSSKANLTKEEILSMLNGEDSYVVIKRGLSSDELNLIKALNLKGLSWQNNPVRLYPQGKLASHIIGFLGGEGTGQYGIEGFYEDILKGKTGILEEKRGLDFIFSKDNPISLDGSDLYLTLDYNIQFQAESLLQKAKENLNIDSGQIIVLKPDSGKIIALANFPLFDLNQYGKQKDLEIFQNAATQKLFEPGSIMKPFTMAAALNEGKITPDSTYIDTGVLRFGTKSIHNFANEVYGEQTMTQVLESSINTGAVYAQQQIDHKTFFNYIEKFGFTEKTGVDLQGEIYSRNEALKNGPDMNYATASFGQGIEMTPLQIAKAFSAIANEGKLAKPYIVEKIISGTDEIVTKPQVSPPIVSTETISNLTSMLVNVVDKGFNSVAKIPGYHLAGKTGTAQVPIVGGRGYDADKTIQSFVGFGPAFKPQFLILVKLDDPKVSKSSLSAVPVFKELAQYIINYWQIPPDYDAEKGEDVINRAGNNNP